MQCHAKSKQSQKQCKKHAVRYGVCEIHGGKTPSGRDSPAYKTGKHSKVIPVRMAATYERGTHDRALLDMRDDVALLDARVADLLARVDTGEAGQIWTRALKAYADMQQAIQDGDTVKGGEANIELGALLRKGRADYQAWDEVGKALEQKRKTVESEHKHQVQKKLMIPITELGLAVQSMAAAVSAHVTDPAILQAIDQDWHRLLGRNPEPGDYWAPKETITAEVVEEQP